jgi:PTH1 family peptidyl-tRNA hydrolase
LQQKIQLIVGLGNPGPEYKNSRHNAGVWFVEMLAEQHATKFHDEPKFHGRIARIRFLDHDCWLLVPTTYMNRSGLSVKAMANFYKIPAEAILVVHDELDFPSGIIRFKQEGGHGGHNGLRDIIQHLQSKVFHRLRIGIGHPGHRDQVLDYVLKSPTRQEYQQIVTAIADAEMILSDYLVGDRQKAIRELHDSMP